MTFHLLLLNKKVSCLQRGACSQEMLQRLINLGDTTEVLTLLGKSITNKGAVKFILFSFSFLYFFSNKGRQKLLVDDTAPSFPGQSMRS
jgi:hypothetical protein